jgi:hypothetical protein
MLLERQDPDSTIGGAKPDRPGRRREKQRGRANSAAQRVCTKMVLNTTLITAMAAIDSESSNDRRPEDVNGDSARQLDVPTRRLT